MARKARDELAWRLNRPLIVAQLPAEDFTERRDLAIKRWMGDLFSFYGIEPGDPDGPTKVSWAMVYDLFPKFAVVDAPPQSLPRGRRKKDREILALLSAFDKWRRAQPSGKGRRKPDLFVVKGYVKRRGKRIPQINPACKACGLHTVGAFKVAMTRGRKLRREAARSRAAHMRARRRYLQHAAAVALGIIPHDGVGNLASALGNK
jgi:hypothetical protein